MVDLSRTWVQGWATLGSRVGNAKDHGSINSKLQTMNPCPSAWNLPFPSTKRAISSSHIFLAHQDPDMTLYNDSNININLESLKHQLTDVCFSHFTEIRRNFENVLVVRALLRLAVSEI